MSELQTDTPRWIAMLNSVQGGKTLDGADSITAEEDYYDKSDDLGRTLERELSKLQSLYDERMRSTSRNGMCCMLSGPGRGDCSHSVGLHGQPTNEYGLPDGWCWPCWKDYRFQELQRNCDDRMRWYGELQEKLKEVEGANQEFAKQCKNLSSDLAGALAIIDKSLTSPDNFWKEKNAEV